MKARKNFWVYFCKSSEEISEGKTIGIRLGFPGGKTVKFTVKISGGFPGRSLEGISGDFFGEITD